MNNIAEIDYVVLGFLYKSRMHGYELHGKIADLSGVGNIWKLKISKLYTILNRLEQSQCVTAKSEVVQNRPPRKVFTITSQGKKVFLNWVSTPVEHGRDFRQKLLAKLFFLGEMNNIDNGSLISKQIDKCQEWKKRFQEQMSKNSLTYFEKIVLKFRYQQVTSYIDWLQWCLHKK